MLTNRLHPLGKQSALPFSYYQEPRAPHTVPAISRQGGISSLTYKFLFFILQIRIKIRPEVQYSKLQKLVHPRELTHTCQRGPPPPHRQQGELQAFQKLAAWAGMVWFLTNFSKMLSPENAPSTRKGGFARRLFPTKAMFYSFKAFVEFDSN